MRLRPRTRRQLPHFRALALTLLGVGPLFGAERAPPLEVRFEGPPSCGPIDGLERELRRLLGARADSADVVVTARATALADGGTRLDLTLEGSVAGGRSLEATDCRDAVRAAAVVLALAIDPALFDETTAPPQVAVDPGGAKGERPNERPEATETPRTTPPPREVPPREPAPGFFAEPTFLPSASLELSDGLTPGPRFGVVLGAGIAFDWLSLEARASFAPSATSSTGATATAPTERTDFWAASGGGRACARPLRGGPWSAFGCVGFGVFHLQAEALDVPSAEPERALVVTAELDLGVRLDIVGPLSVALEGGARLPTSTPRFVIEDSSLGLTVVHEVTAGPTGRVGLVLAL